MKEICFFTASPMTIDVFLREHIEELAKYTRVTVISNFSKGFLELPIAVTQIHVSSFRNISVFWDLGCFFQLLQIISRSEFNAFITITPKAGLLGMMASAAFGVPVRIHWFTGQVWSTSSGLGRLFLKSLDRLTAWLATHLLSDSFPQKLFLIEECVTNEEKIKVIHKGSISGVNINRFSIDGKLRSKARDDLGLGKKNIVFLFLGRINKDKGVIDLVRAFVNLSDDHDDIRLLVVGPDEEGLVPHLEYVAGCKMAKIQIHGFSDFPQYFFAAADVFVVPSYREGFGTVVIEAAASGLPSIVSEIYGLKDSIEDGITGRFFKVGNTSDLRNVMEQFIVLPSYRESLGMAARARVERDFNSAVVTEQFTNYLYGLI